MASIDLLLYSPQLAFHIFCAARFYVAHARIFQQPLSSNLTVLSNALEIYAKRWALAARYSKAIRSAIDELSAPTVSSLPAQFYDPQYSTCDINEALRAWEVDTGHWYYNLPALRTPQALVT